MAIEKVSALVLDRVAVFEFGVICEVFGIDRSADGVPNFDFKVCGPEAGVPLRTSVGATLIPDHGLDDLVGADLVAIPAIGGSDYLPEALKAVRAAADAGHLEERRAALESLTAIKRAGAGTIVTYWAKDLAAWL